MDPTILIPILTNSVGGILVGLVTKHAGSVRKGFALIFDLLLSGAIQAGGTGVSPAQIVRGLLAATSMWLHAKHHPTSK
jgi:UDP-sugar transporter A1/2/3